MRRRRPPLSPRGRIIPALFLAFALGGGTGFWLHARMSRDLDVVPSVLVPEERPASAPPATAGEPAAAEPRAAPPTPAGPNDATPSVEPSPVATIGSDPIAELRTHRLHLPLDSAHIDTMKGEFAGRRDGGSRAHEAVDLLAPRQTPIRAVEAGTIAKLFHSKAGGTTIYQFDPTERFCYYYAHLERYADGLHEGQRVIAGDVIGYVGTSGNASPSTPHLHFAIFKLTDDRHWWQGTAIDPYLVFKP